MRNLLLIAGMVLMPFWATCVHAKVLDFKFSVTDNGSEGFIDELAGTLTGEITGLIDNAASPATAVFIDSAPSALGFNLATPIDITTDGGHLFSNAFTVSGGHIVYASYSSTEGNDYLIFTLNGDDGFDANFVEGPTGRVLGNFGGLAGITFTAVPELSTWALVLLGLAGIGLVTHRRVGRREEQPLSPDDDDCGRGQKPQCVPSQAAQRAAAAPTMPTGSRLDQFSLSFPTVTSD